MVVLIFSNPSINHFQAHFFPHIDSKKMCTLSNHSVTEFLMISFGQHTLAFITSLFFDLMFDKSRIFYENNMILRFISSDPAKSGLGSGAWTNGYDYQNKDTQKTLPLRKNKSVIFQCSVSEQNPCDSTSCYFCHLGRHLEYFTMLKHNNNMSVKFN